MSRRRVLSPAELADLQGKLEALAPTVEAARRDAQAHALTLPPEQRTGLPMLSADASDRRSRIALAVRSFGAPAALADEINARGLTLQQAHDLLTRAAGRERTVNAAGVQQIRLALLAIDQAARTDAARADADRVQAVADLLHRYRLAGTHAGARVAASRHDVATLRTLVVARSNVFGRLDPLAQAGLLRDLSRITPTTETT